MKLRLNAKSLRLRLNQAEVAQFSKTGYVEETVEFGSGSILNYVLETSTKVSSPQVVFQNGEIRVRVNCAASMEWAMSDSVGISGQQALENGKSLSILIEKDFKCLHGDEVDPLAFPNPLEDAACNT